MRRKYPDRHRYAIAPGLVQLSWQLDKGLMRHRAHLMDLVNDELHLSNTLASAIGPAMNDPATKAERSQNSIAIARFFHLGSRVMEGA